MENRTAKTRRGLFSRGPHLIPLALIAMGLAAVPLLALVELPGERAVKDALGIGPEIVQRCGQIRDRGDTGGAWRIEEPLAEPRDEARAVVIGRSAYLAGGLVSLDLSEEPGTADSVDTFQRYDFDEARYVDLPPLPSSLNHVGVAAYGGDIYVAGGHTDQLGAGGATSDAWRYRVDERRWDRIAPMPTARGGHELVVVGDRMYALGGRQGDARLATVEAYDFRTGSWSEQAPMPTARDHLGATAYRGQIYALGGRQPQDYSLGAFERYDPRRDRWTRLPDLPRPVSSIQLEPVGGRLVAPGGADGLDVWVSGGTFAYDPEMRRWAKLPSMPVPKHGYASAVLDGRMWLFGGSSCGAFRATDSVESMRVPPA